MTPTELLSEVRYRLRAVFDRTSMERELDDEVQMHIERETEKYVRQGVPPREAARLARVAFGGLEVTKEQARDARGTLVGSLCHADPQGEPSGRACRQSSTTRMRGSRA